jgi:hypothetical protein
MLAKKYSVIVSLLSMLLFITCKSSLSSCLSSLSKNSVNTYSDSNLLPSCHQTGDEQKDPKIPYDSEDSNDQDCKCAISYSEPIHSTEIYAFKSYSKILYSDFALLSFRKFHSSLHKIIYLKEYPYLSYSISLDTIRLLI